MASRDEDIFGNRAPPAPDDFSRPFSDLTGEQQDTRRALYELWKKTPAEDPRHPGVTGSPPTSRDRPFSDIYATGSQAKTAGDRDKAIADALIKATVSAAGRAVGGPGGNFLTGLGPLISSLAIPRSGQQFRGQYVTGPLPNLQGQDAGGIGGGILSSVVGSLAPLLLKGKDPRLKALLVGGGGAIGKLLGGQLLPALTVR